MYRRTIEIPFELEIKKNILENLNKFTHEMGFKKKIIITDQFLKNRYLKNSKDVEIIENNNIEHIKKRIKEIKKRKITNKTCFISFGGGKINDATKYISHFFGREFISIPTVLSNDGIFSPISVVESNKLSTNIHTRLPYAVLIDIDIIKKSPVRHTIAGIGDVISNYSSIKDWQLAAKNKKDTYDAFSHLLTKISFELIQSIKKEEINTGEGISKIAESLILSGMSMSNHKSTSPASGSEHNFAHVIDKYFHHNNLHGELVAYGTLLMELLRGNDISELKEFYKKIGLPTNISELSLDKKEIISILKKSKTIRNRYTFLNEIEISEDLIHEIKEIL